MGRTERNRNRPSSMSRRTWLIVILVSVIAIAAIGYILYIKGVFSKVKVFFQAFAEYFASGSEGLFFLIAFVVILACMLIWNQFAQKISRKLRAEDYALEKELTGNIVTIDTMLDKETTQKIIARRLRLKYAISRTKDNRIEQWLCRYAGKPHVPGKGDEFTASIIFSGYGENGTSLSMEILRWREKNGVTRKAGLKAMRGFLNEVYNAVRKIDPKATIGAE